MLQETLLRLAPNRKLPTSHRHTTRCPPTPSSLWRLPGILVHPRTCGTRSLRRRPLERPPRSSLGRNRRLHPLGSSPNHLQSSESPRLRQSPRRPSRRPSQHHLPLSLRSRLSPLQLPQAPTHGPLSRLEETHGMMYPKLTDMSTLCRSTTAPVARAPQQPLQGRLVPVALRADLGEALE